MSYPDSGDFLSFFKPRMVVAANDTKPLCAVDIGASSATHGEWVCVRPCNVKQLKFLVTLEAVVGTTTAPTVIFTKRPTPGSSTDAAALGTLTIPNGAAIGKTYYKNITPVNFSIGQAIQISHTVGTGDPAGQGEATIEAEADPEVPGNNSNMIASA